jgi:hypothetical protein
MRHLDKAVAAGVLLLAGAVQAAPVSYSGTGVGDKVGELAPRAGNKVIGTSRCANNEVTINLTVDGTSVKGSFKEKSGPRYQFAATRDASGAFKVDVARVREKGASSGGPAHSGMDDSLIHVRGVINDGGGEISVEDSCLFKATLTKK